MYQYTIYFWYNLTITTNDDGIVRLISDKINLNLKVAVLCVLLKYPALFSGVPGEAGRQGRPGYAPSWSGPRGYPGLPGPEGEPGFPGRDGGAGLDGLAGRYLGTINF